MTHTKSTVPTEAEIQVIYDRVREEGDFTDSERAAVESFFMGDIPVGSLNGDNEPLEEWFVDEWARRLRRLSQTPAA